MQKSVGPFVALSILLFGLCGAATTTGEFAPPNYVDFLTRYYTLYTATSPMSAIKQPKQEAATSPQLALYALRLWQTTHHPDDLERGKIIFDNIISTNRDLGMFDTAPVVRCAIILKTAGKVDPAQLNWLHDCFLKIQAKGYEFRHGNRELGRLWGPAIAAFQLFADDSAFSQTRELFLAWWPKQIAVGDLDENAGNYQSVGLTEFIGIAQAMHHESDLATSDRWRNMFSRLRDGVSPGGHMPEWNDDYFHEGGWPAYIYIFEYAAHLYNDPTFETAARKIFYRQSDALASLKHTSQHSDIHELGAVCEAIDLVDLQPLSSISEEPLLCGVTHRFDELGQQVDDKLILRPTNTPGSPMIWMDLYADGDHSHTEKKGSIGYYEVDQVPLFRGGYGRHIGQHTGDGGNSFYLQRDADDFPIDAWPANQWKTVSLPTSPLPIPGEPAERSQRLFTQLQGWGLSGDVTEVADESGDSPAATEAGAQDYLALTNLRLEGPGGTKVIDDFKSAKASAPRGATLATVDGKSCLKVTPETARFATRAYNIAFDPSQYKVLSYDILQTGKLPSVNFRMPPGPNALHTYGGWNRVSPGPFFASLDSARAELIGHDCTATIIYNGYGTWDSKLTRRILLTAEGALVIHDTFVPGPTAAGWTGGSVWQLPTLGEHGKNWFASEQAEDVSCDPTDPQPRQRGMLVKFAAPSSLLCGVQTSTFGKGQKRFIAFGKLPLSEGKAVTTLTIVLPTTKGSDLSATADSIRVDPSKDETHIVLPNGTSGSINIDLSEDRVAVKR